MKASAEAKDFHKAQHQDCLRFRLHRQAPARHFTLALRQDLNSPEKPLLHSFSIL